MVCNVPKLRGMRPNQRHKRLNARPYERTAQVESKTRGKAHLDQSIGAVPGYLEGLKAMNKPHNVSADQIAASGASAYRITSNAHDELIGLLLLRRRTFPAEKAELSVHSEMVPWLCRSGLETWL